MRRKMLVACCAVSLGLMAGSGSQAAPEEPCGIPEACGPVEPMAKVPAKILSQAKDLIEKLSAQRDAAVVRANDAERRLFFYREAEERSRAMCS